MSNFPPPPGMSPPPPPASGDPSRDWAAITGLVLGCANLVAWCLPFCGFPVGIAAVIISYLGLSSTKPGLAKVGLITAIIGLVLSLLNAIVGVYLQLTGRGMFSMQ